MQGTMISQQAVHLSWGRSPTAKQQADPSQWSSTYYGYGQGYDAYGYGTTHDPSLYAYGAYPGYAQYPQQHPNQLQLNREGLFSQYLRPD